MRGFGTEACALIITRKMFSRVYRSRAKTLINLRIPKIFKIFQNRRYYIKFLTQSPLLMKTHCNTQRWKLWVYKWPQNTSQLIIFKYLNIKHLKSLWWNREKINRTTYLCWKALFVPRWSKSWQRQAAMRAKTSFSLNCFWIRDVFQKSSK